MIYYTKTTMIDARSVRPERGGRAAILVVANSLPYQLQESLLVNVLPFLEVVLRRRQARFQDALAQHLAANGIEVCFAEQNWPQNHRHPERVNLIWRWVQHQHLAAADCGIKRCGPDRVEHWAVELRVVSFEMANRRIVPPLHRRIPFVWAWVVRQVAIIRHRVERSIQRYFWPGQLIARRSSNRY